MIAPVLFCRPVSIYPGNDPIEYAAQLGMGGIALAGADRQQRELISDAVARFGARNTYVWDGPAQWRPSTWRDTIARDLDLCRRFGVGVIPDPEYAAEWAAAGDAEREVFAREVLIAPTREDIPVWLYTFHGHPAWRQWAAACMAAHAPVTACVSMYGTAHGVPRANYAAVLAEWQRRWPGGAGPAIALAGNGWPPGMEASEYEQYLADVYRAAPSLDHVQVFGLAPPLASEHARILARWIELAKGDTVEGRDQPTAPPDIALGPIGPWVPWITWRRRA